MKLSTLALLLSGSSAFASTPGFDLQMNLSINGKTVSSPRVLVTRGEIASVSQQVENEGSFIDVVATEGEVNRKSGKKSIQMSFTVGRIEADGERKILSQPKIISNENETTEITVSDPTKPDQKLTLSVKAKRIRFEEAS